MALAHKLYSWSGPIALSANLHDTQLSPGTGEGIALGGYVLSNDSGANVDAGVFIRVPNSLWQAGIITAASTPDYQGENSGAKSTTANAFVNVFTTTDNDGFLIACREKFQAVSFVVDDVSSAGTYTYTYYNGSSMASVTPKSAAVFTGAAATQAVTFVPSNWTKGTTAAVATTLSDYYVLVVRGASVNSVVSISDVRVYQNIDYYPTLLDQNQLTSNMNGSEEQYRVGSSIAAFMAGTANAQNFVNFQYRPLTRQS